MWDTQEEKLLLDGFKDELRKIEDNFNSKFQVNIPKYVYHYTNTKAGINIKESKFFRLSNIKEMGDAKEWKYGLKLFEEILNNNSYKKELVDNFSKVKERINEYSEGMYVLSTTLSKNNEFLWNEYADNLNGLVLKIDRVMFFHDLGEHKGDLSQGHIIYDSIEQQKIIKEFLNDLNDFYSNYCNDNNNEALDIIYEFLIYDIVKICAFFKKKKYDNEEEFRILVYYKDAVAKLEVSFEYPVFELINYSSIK